MFYSALRNCIFIIVFSFKKPGDLCEKIKKDIKFKFYPKREHVTYLQNNKTKTELQSYISKN